MLLRLQKFDLEVSYRKGTEMHMADPLSRAYLPQAKQKGGDQEGVWSVADMRSPTDIEIEHVDMIAFVPIRQLTLLEIKSATEVHAELQALATLIKQGQRAGQMYYSSCRDTFLSEKNCSYRTVSCSRVNEL